MMQVLLILLFAVTLITLIGHGLWVLLAWLFRVLSGDVRELVTERCRHCGRRTPLPAERCDWCGQLLAGAPTDLPTIISMLRTLERDGIFPKDEVDQLIDRIVAFRRAREEPSRQPAPPPVPQEPEIVAPAAAPPPVIPAVAIEAELLAPAAPPPLPIMAEALESPVAASLLHALPEALPVERPPTLQPVVAMPSAPRPPSKSWGAVITEFMEPHNIRWGELIGGLLFVVGAAALVITQWETLQHLRYFRFVIAMAVSAAVFGMGLYSHYRWKLVATSRGLLTVATLLAPLNFLNLAGLAKADPLWITAALEVAAALLFGVLVSFSARVLVPGGRVHQVAALLGISLAVLWFARRFDPHTELAWLSLAGSLPVAIYAGASGAYLAGPARRKRLTPLRAQGVFQLLGSTAFAVCVALGVLIFRAAGPGLLPAAIQGLSVPVGLAGAATLLLGLTVRQRMRSTETMEPYRLAAMWMALTGGLLMLAALGMAWPRPELLLAVAAFAALTLLGAAVRFDVPLLHGGAMACGAVAYVVGFLLATGALAGVAQAQLGATMLRQILDAPCGTGLAGLFFTFALIGEAFFRGRRSAEGQIYFIGAVIVAAASLAIVSRVVVITGAPQDVVRAALVYGLYGLSGLLLNVRWRSPQITYVSSALLAGSALWWAKDHLVQPWSMAFLIHASASGLAAWSLRMASGRGRLQPLADDLRRTFVEPLSHTSLVSSTAALGAMFVFPWQSTSAVACGLLWLAVIWLAAAWVHRWPVVFAAHQAALAAAVATWLYGLYRDPLGPERSINLFQAWSIGLGLLTLGWVLVRIALRRDRVMHGLLNPGWPMVDQVLKHSLVLLQLVTIVPALGIGMCGDFAMLALGHSKSLYLLEPFSLGAWLALATLAIALIASLWDRWRPMELLDALVLAATLACLVATRCLPAGPVDSALRWTLAIAFVVCSACVWERTRLARGVRALGARLRLERQGARIARPAIVSLLLVPVLLLTCEVLVDGPARQPTEGLFAHLSPTVSYVGPLLLLAAGLVGHALRERSAGYVFSAGLLVELAVALGYLCLANLKLMYLSEAEFIRWIQGISMTTSLWALGWVGGRKFLGLWAEDPEQGPSRTLMNIQLAFGYVGNAIGLAAALLVITTDMGRASTLVGASGSWLGWATLLLAAAAGTARTRQVGRPVNFNSAGLLGMAVVALLACTSQCFWPGWSYRTLMLGWSGYALAVAAAAWFTAARQLIPDAQHRAQALLCMAAVWVRRAGVAAVLLGLWAAPHYREQLWAALAIAIASLAGAIMAVQRRQEGWAFAAALAMNLAASLLVWHEHYSMDLAQWWIVLVQANTIASAVVALIWLAARQRLRQFDELRHTTGPLLGLQTTLGVAGNALLVGWYACRVFVAHNLNDLLPLARAPGWSALLLAAAAAAWYLWQVAPTQLGHVPGALLLGLVTLASAAALPHVPEHPFLHIQIYFDGLAAAALLALTAGLLWPWKGKSSRVAVSPAVIESWMLLLSALAAGGGLYWCGSDPHGPWPLASGVWAVAVATGLLACWRGKAEYVFASVVLVCAAGSAAWIAEHPRATLSLMSVNVICLSLAAALWTIVEALRPGTVPMPNDSQGQPMPIARFALGFATLLLGGVVLSGVRHVFVPHHVAAVALPGGTLDWIAWASLALAMTLLLWDRAARYAWDGLYLTALWAVGLGLLTRRLSPNVFCWSSGVALAGFVALAAAMACLLPRLRRWGRALRIPDDPQRWSRHAFPWLQAVLGAVALALGLWISLDFRFHAVAQPWLGGHSGRFGGTLALAGLLLEAACMSAWARGAANGASPPGLALRHAWQCATLGLAALVPATLGWACLAAKLPLPALHREVILMVSSGLTTLALALAAGRLLSAGSDWAAAARRMIAALGVVAGGLLVLILFQEAHSYRCIGSVPLTPWAIAAVALTLVGSTIGCVALAVSAQPDPLGLSARGRQAYVYAAEILLIVVGIHLRLTVPWLFQHDLIRRYGMFLVLGVAFLWTGLSEIFRRGRRPVLSEPLAITARLLPLLAMVLFFQFGPRTPLVWFLIGAFYSVQAITERSFWLGAAAVVTGNAGLWVLWQQMDLGILVHPQLWLIPLALAALVAEYVSRGRLRASQSSAVRYVSLGVIYLSSSADMFIAGIGNSLGLPLVLLGLSLVGMFCGMALRIRSFVYLGTAFLLLDLATLVKHVAFDLHQTWVFWSCIVLLGAAIIALFAVFEKRRDAISAALDRFRTWE